MREASALPQHRPAVLPGILEEVLDELAAAGVTPTPLNVLSHALDRGLPEDLAVVIAEAAERRLSADSERCDGSAPQDL